MNVKKILACIGAIVMASACGNYAKNYQVKADANNIGDFSEDFESYEVGGFIENDENFKKNWTNNVLKGGESQGMDSHLVGIAKVETEPGNSENKVLHLNNTIGNDSFFQIGPNGDYRTKNFTASFRLKFLVESVPERSWVGMSFRKKAEVHYTGTNNLMFTVQRYKSSAQISSQAYAIFNGGNVNDLLSDGIKEMFSGLITGESYVYTVPNASGDVDMPWVEYKLEVNEKNYKVYVDDTIVMDCSFDAATFDYFGYLSINCCQANVLIDDFKVINNDTELAPEINPLQAPVLRYNAEKGRVEWDEIEGASLYAVYVNGKHRTTKAYKYYTMDEKLEAGEYKVQVIAVSNDTFIAKDSALSEAYVYVVEGQKEKKGCKSSFGGLGAFAVLGVIVILKKTKDNY